MGGSHSNGWILAHTTGGDKTLKEALKSGALLGGEERIRQLGKLFTGGSFGAGSPTTDQANGSSHQIYSRLLKASYASDYNVIMNPKLMLRTRTYSLPSDMYGNLESRKEYSHSNPLDAVDEFTGNGGNETMTPHLSSLLDGIEVVGFETAAARNEMIQELKKRGIEMIRGASVEDRLVMRSNMKSAIEKVKKLWK